MTQNNKHVGPSEHNSQTVYIHSRVEKVMHKHDFHVSVVIVCLVDLLYL